ncbi:hypothetical protein I6F50_04805 [Pseudoalteromonas sp. NZS127_1]|uniref:phosphorylase family protein n=1 Tax=Pseudoalteromonas sp. NZS127_1 TaxID=2792074 RepID=UPI0018CF514D|nr:hypothetical protein [Pseudoalteromonas sp. NZS127_1]MBG9994375.1 hypothetical protein [Pseudoalteromonas sp. NZS127_1]
MEKLNKKVFAAIMNILIIEDKKEKFLDLKNCISEWHSEQDLCNELDIQHADGMQSAYGKIYSDKFDLIVFDVFMPGKFSESEDENFSQEIIFSKNDSLNRLTEAIVLTALPNSEDKTLFNENGITFVSYSDERRPWRGALREKLDRVAQKIRFNFLIFCALTKERNAFNHTSAVLGKTFEIKGLNCLEITINGKKGLCIKPSNMGLVSMAITTSRSIEIFEPGFVGMSGICAGKNGSVNMLDVIACTVAWNYQEGKYEDGKFIQQPHQSWQPDEMRTRIEQFTEDKAVISIIKDGFITNKIVENSEILHGAIASGSTVIADENAMVEIKEQYRKVLGLEMEIQAFHEAALQATCKPSFLAVKTVTDLGNKEKDDTFQEIGSIMSARLICEYITKYYS